VVCHDLPGQQLTAATVVLDAPQSAEPVRAEGVAAIMARTLDEGTELHDAEAFADELDRLGAAYDVSVHTSGAWSGLQAPARYLAPALGLLAEAVTTPVFPGHEIDRHIRIRLGELAQQRATARPRARQERYAACFTEDSRCARPIAGAIETVRGLDRSLVEQFYRDHIGPRRATLVLAGDFTGIDVQAAVAGAFGGWADRPLAEATPQEPVPAAARVVVVDRPGAVQSQIALGMAGPDRRSPDWADLKVAAYALGGGINSRLSALLREEKGYTYGVHAGFEPMRRGGLFTIDTAVQTDSTGPAVADTFAVLRAFLDDGLDETELAAAVDYLTGASPLRYQTASQVAAGTSSVVANDLADDYLDSLRTATAGVTTQSCMTAFREHVDPGRLSLVWSVTRLA
jgi:predicted Zn-dependent peptidase